MESPSLLLVKSTRQALIEFCTEVTNKWFKELPEQRSLSVKAIQIASAIQKFNCSERLLIAELAEAVTGEPVLSALTETCAKPHRLGLMVVPIVSLPTYEAGEPVLFYAKAVKNADRVNGVNGKPFPDLRPAIVRQPTNQEIIEFFEAYPDWHVMHTAWLNDGAIFEEILEWKGITK